MNKLFAFYVFVFSIVLFACTKEATVPSNTEIQNIAADNDVNDAAAAFYDSVLYRNNFNVNAQGWKIAGDAQAGNVEPTYVSTGGNPGGYISATDDVTGGVWYFSAPKKFIDSLKSKYGKILRFDLKQSVTTNQFNADDIILEGGGLILHYNTAVNPGTSWTKYRVPLSAAKWLKSNNTAPTVTEMKNVLKNLTRLWIRGEYITGADTGGLDNVIIAQRVEE